MKKAFRIGSFSFQLDGPETLIIPENFLKFQTENMPGDYLYKVVFSDDMRISAGKTLVERPDLTVVQTDFGESRLLGTANTNHIYAAYQEESATCAIITVPPADQLHLQFDPVFTSLLALERRLIQLDGLVLHCAYTRYRGGAILFSAPSETGKTTQANLWGRYKGSETVNGDRSLLQKSNGVWAAHGWPVCGSSGVCRNESTPITTIVMLSQAKENHVERLQPMQAFTQLFSQITVNRWNRQAAIRASELIENLVSEIPVWHLGCTISEDAVNCLHNALFPEV